MRVMRELHGVSLVSRTPDRSARGECNRRGPLPMRNKFLIRTAALLAGVALASAQNMPGGGRESGGAQSPAAQGQGAQHGPQGGAAAQDRQSPQGERGQSKQGQAQDRTKQGGQKDQTTGQA